MARTILHVDMDAFYASVEVLDDPSLAGRPVIVGGTPDGRGVVAAASYEARRFGVHSAMPAGQAARLCPDAVFLRPRMARYSEMSAAIFAVLRQYTPLVEPLSIDEAFLDVTGCERLFGSGPDLARAIKDRIKGELGLTASVGVAPNKFLAKLASDLEKPDGLTVIGADEAAARLAVLPVGRLWGVGKVTEKELAAQGVVTIGDLLATPRDALRARFGDHVDHLLRLARGEDDRPVVPEHEVKSVGNEVTFSRDIADADRLRDIVDHLADKVAWRLRRGGVRGRTVVLKARYPDFTTHTRSHTLPRATDASVTVRDAARDLLERRLGRRGRPLRLVGVTVTGLEREQTGQAELFADETAVRDRRLDDVMDRGHDRFGPMVRRGGLPGPDDR